MYTDIHTSLTYWSVDDVLVKTTPVFDIKKAVLVINNVAPVTLVVDESRLL